jgi:MATE family multidrug resistance protein
MPSPALPPAARREIAATARLAGPIVGGQLAMTGLAFIDTVMAGRLSARDLAAVAVGGSVWSAIGLFFLGVLMALPPSVAHLAGGGRERRVGPLARQGLWLSLGLAAVAIAVVCNARPLLGAFAVQPEIVPVVVGYLRAIAWGVPAWFAYLALRFVCEGLGDTRPVLYFGLLGLPVNALGNWVLMYGKLGFPALGAVGCGYATAVVWWVQLAALVLYLAWRPRFRRLHLFGRLDPPRRTVLAELLRIGVPIGVAIFVEASLFAMTALVIGSLGTVAVAGHQVALNFVAVTFMVPLGISMAATVRVGRAAGARDGEALRRAAGAGVGLAMAVQVVNAALMVALPRRIAGLYTADAAVVAAAAELLLLAAVFQLSDGLQASAAGCLRGLKDTRAPMGITLLAYWLVGFPLGYALAVGRGWGAPGMWTGLIAGLTLAALLLAARLRRVAHRFGNQTAA